MFNKLIHVFTDDKIEIKERLFRIILVVATVTGGLAILQGLTLVNADSLMLIYCIMFAAFVFALILTFKYRDIELSSTILGIALVFVALPFVFLKGGGVDSGSGVWMSLGLFYIYIMFSGKKMWFFLITAIVIDICCYVLSYQFPEMVIELATPFEKHFDSLF